MMKQTFPTIQRQSGAALLVSLIIMTMVLILTASGVKFSTLDVRAAINDELSSLAIQTAQSGVDGTLSLPGNTPVTGNADETNCLGRTGCTRSTITMPGELADRRFTITVQRGNPAFQPVPRGHGSSIRAFSAAPFSIEVNYDELEVGLGQAEIHEGLIMLVPKF